MWDDLLSHSKNHNVRIRGIWIIDMSHQSASGVLNEDIQGHDRGQALTSGIRTIAQPNAQSSILGGPR